MSKKGEGQDMDKSLNNKQVVQFDELPQMPMSYIYRFFCWCSGARVYLLRKCPSDYNVFFGIGIVIFLTGTMAFISGSYAFYTVFKSDTLALFFGLFWGTLIFFLDWYLVSSLKKQGKLGKEIFVSIPRFLFAIFLGVVIAKPVELKLFEPEIDSKIASLNLDANLGNKSKIFEEFAEIEELKKANEDMAIQMKAKEMQRNRLFEMVIAEAEGTSGTGVAGKGSVYKEKKDAFAKADAELQEMKKSLMPVVDGNIKRIEKLTAKRDEALSATSETVQKSTGFLARLDALDKLGEENKTIFWTNWFITLLFISIESAPIFVKLISARGAYDELMDAEVYRQRLMAKRMMHQVKMSAEKGLELEQEIQKLQNKTSIDLKTGFIGEIFEAKQEIDRKIVEKWKEEEQKKVEKSLKDYLPLITKVTGEEQGDEKTITEEEPTENGTS